MSHATPTSTRMSPADRGASATLPPMFTLTWWMPFAVFVPAYLLRLFSVELVRGPVEDMYMHVQNAFYYPATGLMGPDNWWTSPAKHFALRVAIALFGNDIVGWRLMSVILGALSVVVAALVARRLFRSVFPALATAALLALDPLGIAFSRTTFEDTTAVFVLLVAVLLWLRAMEEGRALDWVLCGVALGVATAFRTYAVIPLAIMLVATSVSKRRDDIARLALALTSLTLVAFCAYFVWWLPWFSRGYSLEEWLTLQSDALAVQGANFAGFNPALRRLVDPQGWLFSWVSLALHRSVAGREVVTMVTSDPFVWALFLPGVAYLLFRAINGRRVEWLFVGLSFLALYGFFALSPRPILLYSALVIVPFGCLALSFAADSLPGRWKWGLLSIATLWGLYLYPLAAGIAVPLQPYAWLLGRVASIGLGS